MTILQRVRIVAFLRSVPQNAIHLTIFGALFRLWISVAKFSTLLPNLELADAKKGEFGWGGSERKS